MPAASLRIAGGFLLFALLALAPTNAGDAEASHGVYEGAARAFSIDLDPFADVENTATSLGSRENCASVSPNGIQDGDEHAVDSITFDVTVSDIPADYPMIAFQFTIVYDQDAFTITGDDTNFLLGYNDGSQIFGASGHETEGWMSAALDIGLGQPESGSGVLARIDMDIESDAASGMYVLSAINIAHIDDLNDTQKPHAFEPAMIAVGMPCPTENDSDGDGVNDIDEVACAGDPFDPNIQPEIIGNGVDEDGDGFTDEPLLYEDNEHFDCDGDGYSGYIEHHVYGKSIFAASNQAPCGAAADDPGYFSPGWPADLAGGWSAHRVNVSDMGAFITPVRRLDTALGDADFHVRFDLVPDNRIDLQDLGSLLSVETPMLGGGRAFNGPPCPWAD